ncbi:tRNA pseudouridine(38-40) synthase TruA [Marinicella rhabdoformis]|uniref:tRNA pseudouridine(38-40) synthase TruA n=1 Tax=Marinicella rhabdoformis TaxID=2580566 RepID=UPI0012AED278|nr:tRNA pseudouridine(38-40) synthase TruA [Marinicella rhabdoformis]
MRIACGIEYDGEPFLGFQSQKQGNTVQSCLEQAISQVANEPVSVFCCGRTDTGVSARHQVIHFDTTANRSDRQWRLGINSSNHRAISVLWVKQVADDFHARFSALTRSYQYTILNRNVKPAINRHHLTWELMPLDEIKMQQAAEILLGTHDFSALRSSNCQSKEPVKTVSEARVVREGELIHFYVTANGFLHHMIRNVMGVLIPIGKGEKPVSWMGEIIESKDRRKAGVTAAPNGLVFAGVTYPDCFEIPRI